MICLTRIDNSFLNCVHALGGLREFEDDGAGAEEARPARMNICMYKVVHNTCSANIVCMYVCMYVCMFTITHVCMYVYYE